MANFVSVLQLTDLHLFAEASGTFNGIDTRSCYREVLNHVTRHYGRPDIILLTGDLAHDGKPAAYRYIAESLKAFNAPVYYVLGNHDCPNAVGQVYPLAPVVTEGHCVLGNWQIVLLDSNHNRQVACYQGEISPVELQRLARLCGEHPGKWTLVAMHHNLPEHDDRGVAIELRNQVHAMQVFQQLPVTLVVSGHVHQEFTIVQQGICYLSTPATGYQSRSKSGQITGEVPGYRWIKLYQNGRFETDVRRISVWAS